MLHDMTDIVWHTTHRYIMVYIQVPCMVLICLCANPTMSYIVLFTGEAIQHLCHECLAFLHLLLWYNYCVFTLSRNYMILHHATRTLMYVYGVLMS